MDDQNLNIRGSLLTGKTYPAESKGTIRMITLGELVGRSHQMTIYYVHDR